jgi:nucleoside-diphosphate-sugar epimerase
MARCLVTGGGGFIGSHLAEGLARARHDVAVLDGFSTGRPGKLAAAPATEAADGDVRHWLASHGGEVLNADARIVGSFPHREVTVTCHDSVGGRYV